MFRVLFVGMLLSFLSQYELILYTYRLINVFSWAMDSGLSLERKKKSAVGKINGLTQVTPSTLAYTIAQVCFYSIFVQLS